MYQSYICLDLETTGLNPKLDRIIQIGAVKVVDGCIQASYQANVNPGRKLEKKITELTGITDEELTVAPDLNQVFPELMDFVEDYPLLGHSILFDYSFLKKAAVDRGISYERLGLDTLKIARRYLPDLESRSLSSLCTYYQIPHHAHRALDDAVATEKLYRILAEQFEKESDPVFCFTPLHFRVKKDVPATAAQKERLYKLIKQHNITLDVQIESLMRSEASRLADQIYSAYGRMIK